MPEKERRRVFWAVEKTQLQCMEISDLIDMLQYHSVRVENRKFNHFYLFSTTLPPNQDRMKNSFGVTVAGIADTPDAVEAILEKQN